MDIVYILGTGSKWDNNELRYSIRSMCRNLHGFRRIILVGEKPEWFTGIHIPMTDESLCKQENIMRKIYRACEIPDISPDFLFVNDDHFLLSEIEVSTIGYFATGAISEKFEKVRQTRYLECIKNTIDTVGDGPWFDIHIPIIYNRRLFRDVMDSVLWGASNTYVIKSLYCNYLGLPAMYTHDNKRDFATWQMAMRMNEGKTWFSTTDHVSIGVRAYLSRLFPDPSPYEG